MIVCSTAFCASRHESRFRWLVVGPALARNVLSLFGACQLFRLCPVVFDKALQALQFIPPMPLVRRLSSHLMRNIGDHCLGRDQKYCDGIGIDASNADAVVEEPEFHRVFFSVAGCMEPHPYIGSLAVKCQDCRKLFVQGRGSSYGLQQYRINFLGCGLVRTPDLPISSNRSILFDELVMRQGRSDDPLLKFDFDRLPRHAAGTITTCD